MLFQLLVQRWNGLPSDVTSASLYAAMFKNKLKTYLFQILSSLDLFLSYRTDSTHGLSDHLMILRLNGWICLHGVLD